MFAGFYYWIGKISGLQYPENLGQIHFWIHAAVIGEPYDMCTVRKSRYAGLFKTPKQLNFCSSQLLCITLDLCLTQGM